MDGMNGNDRNFKKGRFSVIKHCSRCRNLESEIVFRLSVPRILADYLWGLIEQSRRKGESGKIILTNRQARNFYSALNKSIEYIEGVFKEKMLDQSIEDINENEGGKNGE
jgi:hypothetical protein